MNWSVVFFLAAAMQAQPLRPDTRALAAAVKAHREIQKSFIAWVDARLKSPEQIDALSRELRRAKLSSPGRDEFWGTDDTGLLEISAMPLPGAPDLLAVRLGIGVPSGYEETIVLYQRQPRRRIGWLSRDNSQFSSIMAGAKDPERNRLLVSASFPIERRYEGPFTADFRIDRIEGASLVQLLRQEVNAEYNFEPGHEGLEDLFAKASVAGNVATFRYSSRMRNEQYDPAILRYKISGNSVTRVAPLAVTRSGFVDQWIKLPATEAAQWSTPAALEGHRRVNGFLKLHANDDHVYFNKISRCENTWQIEAASAFNAPTENWVFLLSESGAANMRMLSVEKEPRPNCVEYELEALTEEIEDP